MAGMWAQPVARASSFDQDMDDLREQYPELEAVIDAFSSALASNRGITRISLAGDDGDDSDVFGQLVDYPPLGADGKQRFRLTYHAMSLVANPWQRFTLLSIVVNDVPADGSEVT